MKNENGGLWDLSPIYLIMKTSGDRVVPLDPLHPDASTPPARAVPSVPLPNIGKFTLGQVAIRATQFMRYEHSSEWYTYRVPKSLNLSISQSIYMYNHT